MRETEKTSLYDKLSPELVELAYTKDALFDIEQSQAQLGDRVSETERRIERELQHALASLATTQEISDDELIGGYSEIIQNFSTVREIDRFEKMLKLRTKLVPGELVMSLVPNGSTVKSIIEIAGSNNHSSAAQPMMIRTAVDSEMYKAGNRRYEHDLIWSVPVEGGWESLWVTTGQLIGRQAIKDYLDVEGLYSRMSMDVLAGLYGAIGEDETAQEYRDEAIADALDELAYSALPSQTR